MGTNNRDPSALPETADTYVTGQLCLLTTYSIEAIQLFLNLATPEERAILDPDVNHPDYCICTACGVVRQYSQLVDTYTDLQDLLPAIGWTITPESCHQIFRRDFQRNEALALAKIRYILDHSTQGFDIIHQLVSHYDS